MQVTETLSEGLKREYKVVIPAEDLESAVESRLSELAKTVKLKGFRPGKVPLSIIRSRYRSAVLGEVLEQTVQTSTQQAVSENELRPAMQPKVEITEYDDGKDLEFTMGVEVLPDIELGDLSDLKITRLNAEVSEQTVNEALERVAAAEKRFKPVEESRASEAGDALVIDFKGSIDGQARDDMAADGFELELGSGAFIPGFEDQLTGAKAGEHRQVTVAFPADYPGEDVAGKDAVFEVDVKQLREREPVEIDDDLAKSRGLEDLAALRKAISDGMKNDYAAASRTRLKRALLDELAKRYAFDVPPGMVDQEFESIWSQIQSDVERAKAPFEEVIGQTEDEARAEYREIAERRVRLGLVLSEVGRQNGLSVEHEDLLNAALASARNLPNPQQVLDFYRANPQALERFHAPVFEDKVVDFLTELATVTDKTVDAETLFKEPDDEAEAPAEKGAKTAKKAAKKPAKSAATKTTAKRSAGKAAKSGGAKGGKRASSASKKSTKESAKGDKGTEATD